MAAVTYPLWASGIPQAGRWNVTGGPQMNVVSFKPDVGPSIDRRRSSSIVREYSIELPPMDQTQYAAWLTWFHDTLADGVLPFIWVNPITKAYSLCKFVQSSGRSYDESLFTNDMVTVRFNLAVLRTVVNSAFSSLASEIGAWFDFENDKAAIITATTVSTGQVTDFLTFTRATVGTYFGSDMLIKTAVSGALRFDHDPLTGAKLGILLEGARTNIVLHNRDMTNAAWTKTNVTAAKTQIGVDGVTNSASSLTATAGNGTCLQAITLASSVRFHSCYIKRLVGSGTIQMTMNNGSTWTTVTVTAGWTRVSVPSATLANPTVGFCIVTSGDSIAVDFVQNEDGAFISSAIPTTTVAVTRNADVLSALLSTLPYSATEGTLYSVARVQVASLTAVALHGGADNHGMFHRSSSGLLATFHGTTSGVDQWVLGTGAYNTVFRKVAGAWKVNDFAVSIDGAAVTTDVSGTVPGSLTTLQFGRRNSSEQVFGHIKQTALFPTRRANSELQALAA